MKHGLKAILTSTVAMAISATTFAACGTLPEANVTDLTGYVAVDINPSVEFFTDAKGKVASVRAANEDAEVLLSDLELEGMPIEEAVEIVTEEAEQSGYITEENTDVSVTVGAETEEAEEELTEKVEEAVNEGSDIAEVKPDEIKLTLAEQVKAIKATDPELYANLTVAKLKIINSIMEYDRSFTVEEGANMPTNKLVHLLKEYVDEFVHTYYEEIKQEMQQAYEAKIAEIKAQIVAIYEKYAPNYTATKQKLTQLEQLEKKFENALEKDEKYPHGFRFHCNRDFDFEIEGEPKQDELLLTDEMKTELTAVIGEHTITTLEELDEYVDALEETVEQMEESIELTEEEKKQIKDLTDELKQGKKDVREEMKPQMQQAKHALQQIKQQRKQQFGHGRR